MALSLEQLQQQVLAQKTLIPELYGNVDFSLTPERFCIEPDVKTLLPHSYAKRYRAALLADAERVERARLYTLLGDTVSDRYVALMRRGYRMKDLIHMLHEAWAKGIDAVPNAPEELYDFMQALETVPDWIDIELVKRGARVGRVFMSLLAPFSIRGAFIATFMNKYSGMPMALTGALSRKGSGKQRINETASFFTAATLPGALDRTGGAFMAAGMVRLMHSVVRFNLLTRSKSWDYPTYGIPIPQVDQMPAGMIAAFINALEVVASGGEHFNERQQGTVELCRYQSYLLGLPEDLLPNTPHSIFNHMITYAGTLRDGYDEETCGALVRSTMSAYRPQDRRITSRIYNQVETSFSKVYFRRVLLRGSDKSKAQEMGVEPNALDYLLSGAASAYITPQIMAHLAALKIPVVEGVADKILVRRLKRLLREYGHPEYITDAANYVEVNPTQIAASGASQSKREASWVT